MKLNEITDTEQFKNTLKDPRLAELDSVMRELRSELAGLGWKLTKRMKTQKSTGVRWYNFRMTYTGQDDLNVSARTNRSRVIKSFKATRDILRANFAGYDWDMEQLGSGGPGTVNNSVNGKVYVKDAH